MTLNDLQPQQTFVIQRIKDPSTRVQAIRLGLCEGSEITCVERILGGPVIIGFDNQEVAVGRKLAQAIHGVLEDGRCQEEVAIVAAS